MMLRILNKLFNKRADLTEDTSPGLEESILLAFNNANINFLDLDHSNLLEIGSRDGFDALRVSELLNIKSKNVFIVEANPDCCDFIKEKYPLFSIINNAIYNKEGIMTFNKVYKENIGTSSLLDRADDYYNDKSKIISVSAISGHNLLKSLKLDSLFFCKIDVEGATYEVLESFGESLKFIKVLHIECEHKEVWKGQKLYPEIKVLLEEKGFNQIYFDYVSSEKLQSDSIWLNENK